MALCYMCEKKAISKEHVPPKCLFPEVKDVLSGLDYRKNLITVLACAEHNLDKTGDDEYLLYILLGNFNINSVGLVQWKTKIKRSMEEWPAKKVLFVNLKPVIHQGVLTGEYEVDKDRIETQFDRISRGIYYYNFREHLIYKMNLFFPAGLEGSSDTNKIQKHFENEVVDNVSIFLKNETKHGNNPDIFFYQHKKRDDMPGYILRMVFYGGIEVVAISNQDS